LQCIFRILFAHSLQYRRVSPQLWAGFYKIYDRAEQRGYAQIAVSPPPISDHPQPSTCEQIFACAVTMTALDPSRRSIETLWQVDRLLSGSGARLSVRPSRATKQEKGLFVVDLKGNSAPFTADRAAVTGDLEHFRLVDCYSLLNILEGALQRLQFGKGLPEYINLPPFSAAKTLQSLISTLTEPRQRSLDREPAQGTNLLVFGAGAAFYYFNGNKEFAPTPDHTIIQRRNSTDEWGEDAAAVEWLG
jgi:hypothetical protein